MKTNDNKQNSKKPNIVDILIIAVAVCAIIAVVLFAVAMFANENDLFNSDEDKAANMEYTIKVSGVDTELYSITKGSDNIVGCPSLQVGDTVYDRNSGEKIGVITAVTYREHIASTGKLDDQNNLIYAEYPGYVDLFITVEAYADVNDSSYSVKGYDVRVGSELDFRTYGFYADGNVVSVSDIDVSDNSGK